MKRAIWIGGVAAVLAASASSASGQTTRFWLGSSNLSGYYDDSLNWSPVGIPVAADTFVFTGYEGLAFDVRFDLLTGNRGAASLSNAGGSPTFRRSSGGDSTLSISGTSSFTGSGVTTFIGDTANSRMILSLTGLATVDNNRSIFVSPNARLNFGEMRVGTSSGNSLLVVSQDSSIQGTTLEIGRLGLRSNLNMNGGTATVSNLRVGSTQSSSNGRVSIYGGASLIASFINVGGPANATGLIEMYGGTLQSLSSTVVGGTNAPNEASVVVRTGSSFVNESLSIQPTGVVTIAGGTVFANSLSNLGRIRLEAGELRYAGNNSLGNDGGVFEFAGGTVRRSGSGVTTNDAGGFGAVGFVFNGQSQVLRFGQTLAVDGSLNLVRPLQLDGGTLRVGAMSNSQNLDFRSGTFETFGNLEIWAFGPVGGFVDLKTNSRLVSGVNLTVFYGSTLLMRDGATATATSTITIGGNLALDGIGARLTGGTVSVASGGVLRGRGIVEPAVTNGGTIELSDDGALRINSTITNTTAGTIRGRGRLVAPFLTNQGRMEFSGGFTDIETTLTNQATARVVVSGGGVLTLFGNVTHSAGADIRTGTGSRTVFLRPVTGAGTFSGPGLVQFENTYTPGSSPGLVSFGGDVELTDLASLGIELAGSARGSQYDALDVAGSIDLRGRLALSTLDGYVPAYGVGHRVIDASSRSGLFQQITGIELSPTRFLAVTYNATGDVFVTAALPGDTNLDGSVNFTDLLAVAQNFNATSRTWSEGDFGGDTQVGFGDLLVLAQNFGASVLASDEFTLDQAMNVSFQTEWARAMAVVPEPTMLGVLALGAWALVRRR